LWAQGGRREPFRRWPTNRPRPLQPQTPLRFAARLIAALGVSTVVAATAEAETVIRVGDQRSGLIGKPLDASTIVSSIFTPAIAAEVSP
jgi:hypothetical protein